MMNELVPFFAAWAVLATVVVGLAVYRWVTGLHEDDSIHLQNQQLVQEQGAMARKLNSIERWGKSLTAVVVVTGLVLAGFYLHAAWVAHNAATLGTMR